ncbi:shikimate kinase [Planctomicrobium sp. SH661]|uniref:shikimate kinase n=1 Tax=Planctomicrobium sp. SH661 TaxID=3448124 RepID=UPI003F5BDBE6
MAITIIGYRGSGKSTVGAELARRLGWNYIDTDPLIEKRAGKSISQIFAEDGEPRFRDLESGELSSALAGGDVVVSAGGGAILREGNRQSMRAAGPVIWLVADLNTIAARISADPTTLARRPALTNRDPVSEIQEVLVQRQPLYAEAATITVQTDNRTPASIVDEIMTQLPLP